MNNLIKIIVWGTCLLFTSLCFGKSFYCKKIDKEEFGLGNYLKSRKGRRHTLSRKEVLKLGVFFRNKLIIRKKGLVPDGDGKIPCTLKDSGIISCRSGLDEEGLLDIVVKVKSARIKLSEEKQSLSLKGDNYLLDYRPKTVNGKPDWGFQSSNDRSYLSIKGSDWGLMISNSNHAVGSRFQPQGLDYTHCYLDIDLDDVPFYEL